MLIISSILLLLVYLMVDQFNHSKRLANNPRFWIAVFSFVLLMTVIFQGMR